MHLEPITKNQVLPSFEAPSRLREGSHHRCSMTRLSPNRSPSSFLAIERNSESSHRDALSAAQVEHDRVREAAIRVYELHELKEEHQRILDRERREEQRLKAEAQVAAEEKRLQELRAKSIPIPAPLPVLEPVEQPAATQAFAVEAQEEPTQNHVKAKPSSFFRDPQQNGQQMKSALSNAVAPEPQGVFANGATTTIKSETSSSVPKPDIPFSNPAQPPKEQALASNPKPVVDRLLQIHRELKALRTDLMAQSKVAGSPFKGKLGALRREIRVAVGQLTTGKGANAQPTNKIVGLLKEAIDCRIPSYPVEVNRFVAEPREPTKRTDDATLPSLFIYLINVCAKGIVNQFINECGANPKAADPIGIFTAHLFSHKDFQWRGHSLIDILLAKFRVVCPALFGLRGSEKTERGRLALGWRRDGPTWITEQSHNDRMTGLGAGFAAMSLRDFSKSSKENPYPPTHYWKALSLIINTPASETSNTQCVVLRAMIDGHEERFLTLYGNAAVAALRLALVDFPQKAPHNAPAAGSLRALAEVKVPESDGSASCGV
ncbi:hypothetical protein XA68_15781 [Ophiocordyceps unilateralis]|uniref:mRNA export factor GLE1 n=1 Tax=Ophiocordyceps unilateralis TaxID=268505 RepID=A0A2A9P7P5_OPHUN|nr:hypothetical protein XA68_15781 [Ophiocordyceps unilateralis]